jgi:hypothetical protein
VVYRLLQPGEMVILTAPGSIRARVGDPAALEYTVNGLPGRSLGIAGQPRTIVVTPENYREFVATAPRESPSRSSTGGVPQ